MASVFITPDLRWDDIDDMLDPLQNDLVVEIPEGELLATVETASSYVGPLFPIIDIGGVSYEIPTPYIWNLRAHNTKHYYRLASGALKTFTLLLDAGGV